ncbi:DDB1- and CUL4-associated factor 4-like isoform X2 [Dendronephthya gigantea]|uniref:DDB1- and CUL4-associated factor 4-like isoform X2 n=1 Tax=Dendronephthya gigantea TaxID=151771 RepID=UPI00106D79F2|nr:DDB1- and CUL4-associated factor 4-like isoform X2 [Dendronephthya gigantea]
MMTPPPLKRPPTGIITPREPELSPISRWRLVWTVLLTFIGFLGEFKLMDGQRHRSGARKESENSVNYYRGRREERKRNGRQRRRHSWKTEKCTTKDSSETHSAPQVTTTGTSLNNEPKEIPGFVYDSVRKRYFKQERVLSRPFTTKSETKCQAATDKPISGLKPVLKVPSRLEYFQKRTTNFLPGNNVHLQRGLDDWARNIFERKSVPLGATYPCPAFKGSLSCLALSQHSGKLVTIARLPGIGCNSIHIYDIKDDKMTLISPHLLATIIVNSVTHVEWNPHKGLSNFFLLNVFGSGDLEGGAVVCKFDESLQSCELNSYPLTKGTAWNCSWSRNPQFSTLLGIAGNKQAVLVDSERKSLVCKIRSSSDVFCIEFGKKSPVAYLGCRNGSIMCMDIRLENDKKSKVFNISGKVGSSTSWMKVMQDENYLMSSNTNGMIKMWDVRLLKPVKYFPGNVNEVEVIPFVMDSSESIMASAGHDGKTRIWSIQTCEVLKTIHETHMKNGYPDIPAVCLGENWASRSNLMAFGLGMGDKLKMYY